MENKKEFITELIANVQEDILMNINKIPEDWNGIELRQYISDMFSQVVITGIMSKKRKREYNNTIIVNNLL